MIALNPHSLCVKAEPHYYDFIFGKADEPIPEDIVRHIEGCPNCEEQLNRLKYALSQVDDLDVKQGLAHSTIAAMLRLHFGYIGKPVTCRVVKPFLPTLLDPVLQIRIPTPITVHLDNCRQCSEDLKTIQAMNLNRKQLSRLSRLLMEDPSEDTVSCFEAQLREEQIENEFPCEKEKLHDTLCRIVERAESVVVTTYHLDESAGVQSPAASDYPYAGYPIRVEVAGFGTPVKSKKPTLGAGFTATLKRAVPATRFRRFAKIAVVAAAVLIAVRLFFTTPSAKAITLAEINRALESVRNVYIAHFVPGRDEPVQEQWVSRGLGFYLIKTGQELILRDVLSGQMKVRQLGDDSTEIRSMLPEMIGDTDKKMAGSFGLIPFTELSRLPQGSQWGAADKDQSSTVPEGVEVYDLTWVEENPNSPTVMRKWRFFVDSRTGLPQRVELYRKSVVDGEYELQSVKKVEYLNDKQMQETVDEVFPSVSSWQPEGMSIFVSVAVPSDQ